jgi:hypothetical protein
VEDLMDVFRRYVPGSEIEALKAEWAEEDRNEAAQAKGNGETASGGGGGQ